MLVRLSAILIILFVSLKSEAAVIGQALPETDPKFRIVSSVFEKLSRVVNRVPPKLYVLRSDSSDKPLKINLGVDPLSRVRVNEEGKYVAIDESLVDLMAGLGTSAERDNGLAFLL